MCLLWKFGNEQKSIELWSFNYLFGSLVNPLTLLNNLDCLVAYLISGYFKMDQVETYLKAHRMQKKDLQYMFDEFSEEIAKMRGRCADLGCGLGISSELLLKMLPEHSTVVGVDISEPMIKYAAAKYSDQPRLSFIQLDIATKTLPPQLLGAFDNVVSTMCIHWCHDYKQVFENIFKLLRPGGKALVLFLAKHPVFPVYSRLQAYKEYETLMNDFSQYITFLQDDEHPEITTKKILEKSGFQVLHCSHRERTYVFENWDEIQRYAIAVNPFLKRITNENEEKKYKDDLARELRNTEHAFLNEIDGKERTEKRILSVYRLLIAYFKKPTLIDVCKIQ